MALSGKQTLPDSLRHVSLKTIQPVITPGKKGLSLQSKEGALLKITLNPGQDVEALAKTLSTETDIEYAEPNYKVAIMDLPNDPYYVNQTYLSKTTLPFIWQLTIQQQVLVAVVDTGVDYTHEDLVDAIAQNENEIPNNGIDDDNNGYIDDRFGYNFFQASSGKGSSDPMDEQSHGTHLSGIIAAQTDNHLGISGINPDAKILPVRFLDADGSGTQLDGAMAIRYAVDRGAKIINCSWGYYKLNTALDEAIRYAIENGVIVIAAVGNTNTNILEYPSACTGVFGIASASSDSSKAPYSTFGPQVDFMTYGSKVYSTLPNNQYGTKSGTSQAAAVMSGIVSRLLGCNPDLTAGALYELLRESAKNGEQKDSKVGYGIIEAPKLIASIQNNFNEAGQDDMPINTTLYSNESKITNLLNYPNPIRISTTFGFNSSIDGADVTIKIYDLNGEEVDTLQSQSTTGYNKVSWNPGDLNNGTYVYVATIKNNGESEILKGKLSVLR